MADSKVAIEDKTLVALYPSYMPNDEDLKDLNEVLNSYTWMRNVMSQEYNYFNGRNLYEVIDDWMKRWNGFIPPMNPLIDQTQSQIFVNFTRNAVISYLARVALNPVKSEIIAVNKKTGLPNRRFAEALKDMNQYSLNEENGPAKFLQNALEACVKGTVVVYEGYLKNVQEEDVPYEFDAETGKVKTKKQERVIFDNCYQKVVRLEDFFIYNAFEPDVQKQPKIIWRQLTSYFEAWSEFSHYENWKYVVPGRYTYATTQMTFYTNELYTSLTFDQVEILRYFCRRTNKYILVVNGIVMYSGPIPFKDGKYPFAKTVNEPFGNDFFWGNGHPGKYMGEQDLINSFINMMADKTINSLLPTGLSSDLDDLIEDDTIQIGKIRKVSDISKWMWWEAPPVNSGEQNMFQQVINLAKESANVGAADMVTPEGGKVTARQVLLKQQDLVGKLSFNTNFLEDLEVDRTKLRLSHIMQFYAIPKIEKITGKNGKELNEMVYRDIKLSNTELSDGRKGTKVIKLIGDEYKNPDNRLKLADELSVLEEMGEEMGSPTEAMAMSVDTFNDFNTEVQVIKNSSFERNLALDQATRTEFVQQRLAMAAILPIANPKGLIEWWEEAYDIDPSQFEEAPVGDALQQGPMNMMSQPQPGTPVADGINKAAAPMNLGEMI